MSQSEPLCFQCGAPATWTTWLFTGEPVSVCDDNTCRRQHEQIVFLDEQRFLNIGLTPDGWGGSLTPGTQG